jgi:hypothetical protein
MGERVQVKALMHRASLGAVYSTVLRPNTRHAHSPTHHIQAGLCIHRSTSSLYTLTVLLVLYVTKIMIGSPQTHDGDAGRWTQVRGADCKVPHMPHPGPRCAHTEDRPLPRPAATPSHHMQVGGLSLCVSACLPLAHHQGSCQAPSLQLLHSYHSGSARGVAYTCMAADLQQLK